MTGCGLTGPGRRGARRALAAVLSAVLAAVLAVLGAAAGPGPARAQEPPPPPRVLAWGFNGNGQLGDGTTTRSLTPVPVTGLPAGVRVTAVAGGDYHSLALTSGGQVYAWGYNGSGQLGDGTFIERHSPVRVELPGGVRVTAVAGGDYHSLALTSRGRVYTWGNDRFGQLGDGALENRSTPVRVRGRLAGVRVTAVAGGGYHSLALTSRGRVYAWGYNGYGELGDGTTTERHSPVRVDLPAGVRATEIAAGRLHSLALASGGPLYAWGLNDFGQLGDGTTIDRHTPVPVDPPVTAIDAGREHSLALEEGPLAEVAKTGPGSFDHAGQTLTYIYVIRNLGNVPLHGVTLTDSKAGRVSCPDSLPLDTVRTCTATYTATAGDAAARQVLNTATLTGQTPVGTPVSFASNRVTVPLEHRPYAQVAKTGPGSFDHAGQTLTYIYVIRNLGNVPLHGVTLTDSKAGRVSCPDSLPLDAVRTCTATYRVTSGDAANREVLNTATLAGWTPAGTRIGVASNQAIVPLEHRPYAQVAKTGPQSFSAAGQRLTYRYVIRNLGNAPLHAVTLTDSKAGRVSCPASLPLDAVRTCTATYTTTAADAANREVLNTSTLAGRTPGGTRVSFASNQVIVPLQAQAVVPVTG